MSVDTNLAAQMRERKRIQASQGSVRNSLMKKPAMGVDSALARRSPTEATGIRRQARAETQQMVGQAQDDRWSKVFAAPTTEHQTQFSMPGLNTRPGAGGMSVNTGGARALDTPFQWDMGTGGTQRHELSPADESARALAANQRTRSTYGENPGRGRMALLAARGANDPNFDAMTFMHKQQAREEEMGDREALRQQRGIQRGDAMQQAQLGAIRQGAMLPAHLRQQQQMNPQLAMMMQRRPELALEMMKLQQQGMLGQQQLGLRGMEIGQQGALAQQEMGMRGQELQSREGIESMRINADYAMAAQRQQDAQRMAELREEFNLATTTNDKERIANEARDIDARVKRAEAEAQAIAANSSPEAQMDAAIRESLPQLVESDPGIGTAIAGRAREALGMQGSDGQVAPDLRRPQANPETGTIADADIENILGTLVGEGLRGEELLQRMQSLGVNQTRLRSYLLDNTPGMIGKGMDKLRYLMTMPGNFGSERMRMENKYQPLNYAAEALGMGRMPDGQR